MPTPGEQRSKHQQPSVCCVGHEVGGGWGELAAATTLSRYPPSAPRGAGPVHQSPAEPALHCHSQTRDTLQSYTCTCTYTCTCLFASFFLLSFFLLISHLKTCTCTYTCTVHSTNEVQFAVHSYLSGAQAAVRVQREGWREGRRAGWCRW